MEEGSMRSQPQYQKGITNNNGHKKEQLGQRVRLIKSLLHENTWSGADLLADLAYRYAVKEELEDEVILLKMKYQSAQSDGQKLILEKMVRIADSILEQYDTKVVEARRKRKEELAALVKTPSEKPPVVLQATNIEKTYPNSGFKLTLNELELRLGEITGLIGENATGKTTLFRILARDLTADKGSLIYPLFQKNKRLNSIQLKKQIAYVPQELPIWVGPLEDNLSLRQVMIAFFIAMGWLLLWEFEFLEILNEDWKKNMASIYFYISLPIFSTIFMLSAFVKRKSSRRSNFFLHLLVVSLVGAITYLIYYSIIDFLFLGEDEPEIYLILYWINGLSLLGCYLVPFYHGLPKSE